MRHKIFDIYNSIIFNSDIIFLGDAFDASDFSVR
jgi:hypothetical protein